MDGDASSFTFPSTLDYSKGQDATDISWADIFLDGIHSDDTGTTEAGGISTDTSNLAASIHGSTRQFIHQQQPSVVGGQLQIHIPTHLQGSLTSNAVPQANANLCGTVAYLTPASTNQQVSTAGRIQNVMAVAGQHQMTASVGQQQQHQGNAKLVQIASSFPMASVQQLTNSVPIQTLLQSNQTLTGQTIYSGQGTGLFPAQGSVHIENPKVVNVNFGPHVIGSDGSGQQAIIQTAEGKRVLITNSQLQHMPQSISLTQPLVGTQLINSAGGGVIRASMAPGTHTIMPASGTTTQQIVLPSGQTVIPRQGNTPQTGIAKNVVLRPLNQNMSPVIYQSGQGGSLIHSQPTLITSSGAGLQVVNAAGSQGGQVQLIAQPSISQARIGQQQLNQGTIMNLINNQGVIPGTGNQIAGLVPSQNIFVNGQMLNISQLGNLTLPQLQVQHNPQGGVTLTNINAQFQPTTQQLVIQHNGQQQMLIQPKNTQSPSVISNNATSQRLSSGLLGTRNSSTPTSNANNSASSTPVLTPTPSTPTPTPTPDLMSDSCDSSGKGNQGINILEQALAMSAIDLQSFEEDFNFFDNADCFSSSETTPPTSIIPNPPLPKPKVQSAKVKSKSSKSKSKIIQPTVNVTVNSNVQFQQPIQLQNAQGQKVTLSPQQKIITANGQVYVLSSNGQQFILQPSASPIASQLKTITTAVTTAGSINTTNISIPTSSQLQIKRQDQSGASPNIGGQLKLNIHNTSLSLQQNVNAQLDNKFFIKASPNNSTGTLKIEASVQPVPTAQIMFTTMNTLNNSPSVIAHTPSSQTFVSSNETQFYQGKNQTVTTLSGMFVKQEPTEAIVKQEPVSEIQQCFSHVQDLPNAEPSTINVTSSTSLAATTSSIITLSTPLVVSSALFTALTTTTTQSHQVTIMSTAPLAGSRQMYVTAAGTSLPQSSLVVQSQSTSSNLSTTQNTSATTKSNSKEKDPATIKTMIPVKIADSTLMLSLTPGEKERLEIQLSHMSKKDQEGLLMYQQNIIRRTQQVQQKQMEQHLKQKKLLQQQPQEFQQIHRESTQQSQQTQQVQQLTQQQIQQFSQQQQSSQQQQNQTISLALKLSQPSQVNTRSEILSPQPGTGLPTTVQELMEKTEEQDSQQSFQQFSNTQSQEQSQQINQISSLQQSHPNLQQRDPNVQQYLIPGFSRCLAEQQLLRDRSLAVSPDVNTPFKSLSDAMRRLVRYHTLQDHKPEEESKTMKSWDTRYTKLCDYLVKKKRCYLRRFSKMQLYNDMCQQKRPEHIQNLMCFNEQLKELIENEKEKATNNPELFEPIHPEFLTSGKDFSSANTSKSSVGDVTNVERESSEEKESYAFKKDYFGVKEAFIDPDNGPEKIIVSPYASPNSYKRKLPDKGSTGTLKLVLKRRTTDNFIVKTSSSDDLYKTSPSNSGEYFHKTSAYTSELTSKTKSATNVGKSDSEYDFDSQTNDMSCNVVRQRTSSVVSRHTSSDSGSDNGSFISHTDKNQDHSSVDEDLEEEEEEEEKTSEDDSVSGEQFLQSKHCSKRKYNVLFDNETEENVNDDSCSVSADAFMETDEMVIETDKAIPHFSIGATNVSDSSMFRYKDKQCLENLHSLEKTSHLLSNSVISTSDAFNSSLSFPLSSNSPSSKELLKYDNLYSSDKRLDNSTISLTANAIGIPNTFNHTLSPTQDEEYISETSIANLEKDATRKDLSSSLFTTPNKSLLETDDMFNSDDEDDLGSSRRIVSTFEIDNKDPQSSMINDSVRSAINSVLDGGDDDDEDSQTSWASASARPSSSSSAAKIGRNLFHTATSSSFTQGHDADLDAAVQSILNG